MRAKVRMPTDDEEAVIQRGIAADPYNPELTNVQVAEMRPAAGGQTCEGAGERPGGA